MKPSGDSLEDQNDGGGENASSIETDSSPHTSTYASRHRWLFRLLAVAVIPVLILLLLEAVLRTLGYGYDPNLFKELTIEEEPCLVQNDDFSRRFFPPETMRHPNALRMWANKPAGSIRIFVLGESAAMGDPEPTFGPARYLESLLWQRYPEAEFEVVNVAFTAINSHVIRPIARECAQHEGDLWIIYMGNNEMVGPFGAATVFGMQAPPRIFVKFTLVLQRTRAGQLAVSLARKLRKSAPESPSWGGMQMFLDQRVAPHSAKREAVYRNFKDNLEDILDAGLGSGAGIILSTVAVNLRDSPPFASLPGVAITEAARARCDELMRTGVEAQEAGDWPQAAGCFSQVLELDNGLAEAHYRRAVCLENLGQLAEAEEHYHLACDTDALPFRADSRLNALIREAAARQPGGRLRLLDAESALANASPVAVCGEGSFYEHVHLNFEGAYRLGLAWAQAVEPMLPQRVGVEGADEWASQASCERRLGLTDWNKKLVLRSVSQRFERPPLNAQFNNDRRKARLLAREQALLAHARPDAAAQATAVYSESIAARPEDYYLRESFAAFLEAAGDLSGATREWRRVAELLPHDFLPWYQIGALLARQEEHGQAQDYLSKALELRPDLIEGWSQLGQSLGAMGELPRSLTAFERACQLRPDDPVLWAFRAKVLGSLERRSEAIDCYRKAIELDPASWQAHGALGDQYSLAGNIPEAIAEYEAAILAKPDYAVAHLNLGVMFTRQGRLTEAIRKFEDALALEPDNPSARDYLQRVIEYRDRKANEPK